MYNVNVMEFDMENMEILTSIYADIINCFTGHGDKNYLDISGISIYPVRYNRCHSASGPPQIISPEPTALGPAFPPDLWL